MANVNPEYREESFGLNAGIYQGPDGILFRFDPSRNKKLSVARMLLPFGREGNDLPTGTALVGAGNVTIAPATDFQGLLMVRNATLVSITAWSPEVTTDVMATAFDAVDQTGTRTILSLVALSVGSPSFGSILTNEDIDEGSRLYGYTSEGGAGAGIDDPIVVAEIAWRDDS